MQATFKTFESGAGDCLFLILRDEQVGDSFHIMVDCNVLTPEIKHFIYSELGSKIDTLIITHIDADHTNGIVKLLRDIESEHLQINQILFNGFQPQTDNPQPLDDEIRKKLDAAMKFLPPIVDENNHKTNGVDAACLVTEINKKQQWKDVWRKTPILAGETIALSEAKWGRLRFLSPTQNSIDKLLHEVKLEYARKLGVAPPKQDFENQDKYFELMLRLSNLRKRPTIIKKTRGLVITKDVMVKYAEIDADENAVTPANKASLAFYWESTDSSKRVLMMGDAIPSQILSQLNEIYEGTMQFEAVKISHHGSKNNTSISLLNKISSEHYFITGGKSSEGPHIETIARIAILNTNQERSNCNLHYNHTLDIELWKELNKTDIKSLLDEYHITLQTENTHEFEY